MVDFLIMGGGQNIGDKVTLDLLIKGKIWYGPSIKSGYRLFEVPDDYEFYGTICENDGDSRYIAVSGVRWFTNIDVERPGFLELKKYDPDKYSFYDGTDIINIDRTEDIPDYDGLMGVPITFLDKWNPDQFYVIKRYYDNYIDGKSKYYRLLIKRK